MSNISQSWFEYEVINYKSIIDYYLDKQAEKPVFVKS